MVEPPLTLVRTHAAVVVPLVIVDSSVSVNLVEREGQLPAAGSVVRAGAGDVAHPRSVLGEVILVAAPAPEIR